MGYKYVSEEMHLTPPRRTRGNLKQRSVVGV